MSHSENPVGIGVEPGSGFHVTIAKKVIDSVARMADLRYYQ